MYGNPDFEAEGEDLKQGHFVEPMVIENIDTDSASFHEEFFGPVFNLYKAADQREAIKLANKSDYGLCGAIFGKDKDQLRNASTKLRVGSIFLNDAAGSFSDLPFGGVKGSGIGRECYQDGLLEMANRKPVVSADPLFE